MRALPPWRDLMSGERKDNICPECKRRIPDKMLANHLASHWDYEPHPMQRPEANRRYHLLLDMVENTEVGE